MIVIPCVICVGPVLGSSHITYVYSGLIPIRLLEKAAEIRKITRFLATSTPVMASSESSVSSSIARSSLSAKSMGLYEGNSPVDSTQAVKAPGRGSSLRWSGYIRAPAHLTAPPTQMNLGMSRPISAVNVKAW